MFPVSDVLSLSRLLKEARWRGATSDALDAAADDDEPKMALVALISELQKKQTESVADTEPEAAQDYRLDVVLDAAHSRHSPNK